MRLKISGTIVDLERQDVLDALYRKHPRAVGQTRRVVRVRKRWWGAREAVERTLQHKGIDLDKPLDSRRSWYVLKSLGFRVVTTDKKEE